MSVSIHTLLLLIYFRGRFISRIVYLIIAVVYAPDTTNSPTSKVQNRKKEQAHTQIHPIPRP